jgi:hypothetical protein
MREAPQNQASGLGSLARSHSARLVAMVSHGDQALELPLLWRLCLTWVKLGYPVTVLDAGSVESADSPGLAQLLECPYAAGYGSQEATAWSVLPAATGLGSMLMSAGTEKSLVSRLASLFAEDGVVVLYSNADTLLQLLPDTTLQPLMTVSSAPESLLTSYLALKRLLSSEHVTPLVIDQSPATAGPGTTANAGAALADCAQNFLAYELKWIRLKSTPEDDTPTSDLQRLALRILENALPLSDRWMYMASAGTKMGVRQFSRSH